MVVSVCAKIKAPKLQLLQESEVMAERDQVTIGDGTTQNGAGTGCPAIMGPQFLSPAGMFHQEILVLSCFHIQRLSQKESLRG